MLSDKKIIVFGANGLLGSALTISLLNKGAHVIAVDLNHQSLHNKIKDENIFYKKKKLEVKELDITKEEYVVSFFQVQINISGVVNCSYPRNKTYGANFLDVSLNSFNDNVSLHLGSSFLLMQQAAKYFNSHKSSFSFVNIASIYGVVAPKFSIYDNTTMTMPIEYAAIKSAIIHLNKYVANYISNSSFRVNSISPGGVFNNQSDLFLQNYKESTHGDGMLKEKDVLGSILFLLSDESRYITGQNIIIDDGFSL